MIYSPEEDSYLLSKEVKKYLRKSKNKDMKILDMGSGSGIQSVTCINNGIDVKKILAIDINPESIKHLKNIGLNVKKSNLFSNIPSKEKFDLIIFNPPYLPEDKYDKGIDTTGGKKGYELIIKFLKQAKNHLSINGLILILISNLSKPKIIKKESKNMNYIIKKLANKYIGFFENIEVWEIKRK